MGNDFDSIGLKGMNTNDDIVRFYNERFEYVRIF